MAWSANNGWGGAGIVGTSFQTPLQILGSSLSAWYDPRDMSTLFQDSAGTIAVTASGQPVGKILDKSGNNFHLTQATSSSRPTWQSSGGISSLLFDGTDDYLFYTGTVPVQTAIIGAKNNVSSSYYFGLITDTSSSGNVVFAFSSNNTSNSWYTSLASSNSSLSDASHMWSNGIQTNAFGNSSFICSADATGATATLNFLNGIQIAKDRNLVRYFNGNIYNVVIANVICSQNQRQQIEQFIGSVSGIVV